MNEVKVTTNRESLYLGVIGSFLSAITIIYAWEYAQQITLFTASFIFLVGLFMCTNFTFLRMSEENIIERSIFSSRKIDWSAVERIEVIDDGQFLVFMGKGNKIRINGPSVWYGGEREKMIKFLATQAKQRNIDY